MHSKQSTWEQCCTHRCPEQSIMPIKSNGGKAVAAPTLRRRRGASSCSARRNRIDCGLPATSSYVDDASGLRYVSDDGFVDDGAGVNRNIRTDNKRVYRDLRSFPEGVRNCYTLQSLEAGRKYLIRAWFMYGNYDDQGQPPIFDLYLGVNFWATVNTNSRNYFEVITLVPDDFVQVCLVNTGVGVPYISALELRPVNSSLYPGANTMQSLSVIARTNFGGLVIRYPDDPLDRRWYPDGLNTTTISTADAVRNRDNDPFQVPSKVMQTAVTPPTGNTMTVYWNWSYTYDLMTKDPTPSYLSTLFISELQLLPNKTVRQFFYHYRDDDDDDTQTYSPKYLYTEPIYCMQPFHAQTKYSFTLKTTANSTLPPIINAFEAFVVISTAELGTDSRDVSAIMAIKAMYKVHKNWIGDPCAPNTFVWDGLTCSYVNSSRPRITKVNMSSLGLSGFISSAFANLTAVQYLDLSNNNLSGTVPDSLSQLSSLQFLDLTGNHLSRSIPPGILKRIQDGTLILNYDNNSDSSRMSQGKSKLAMYIAIPVVLVVVIVSLVQLTYHILRRQNRASNVARVQSSLQFENRRFTYSELETITNNFETLLGEGGTASVFRGVLEEGTQVAVKLLSGLPEQVPEEFLTEAQILTRIHHKNLVSMMGYCKDGEHMALVYEYMPEGTLQEHISGNAHNGRLLTWRQRLRIAVESAQGLEYLHNGCSPTFVHRDVKPTNILLNAKLEAKIADFGFSKVFIHENHTHISTDRVVGTFGYIDPEYYTKYAVDGQK
ncbi:hypothetical protein PAHAL_3G162700 [Panicum hallii]|uniref:non-specific serine/threonine protein kinase n=1 Tax=Panicum hallii TaxID=206008 RepID=A0A2T8KII3_9POAL|nr:hypothetical protein PAHAL_3G162700 [Panicum hallii]